MGKLISFFIFSHIAVNGWWFVITQQATVRETPLVVLVALVTMAVLLMVGWWLLVNWNTKLGDL